MDFLNEGFENLNSYLMKVYCLLFCMIISFGALGQSGEYDKLIYLKDSRFFQGKIVEEEYGEYLKLSTDKDEIITIPSYHIRRVKKKTPNTIVLENGKTIRTKGYYNYSYYSNSLPLEKVIRNTKLNIRKKFKNTYYRNMYFFYV